MKKALLILVAILASLSTAINAQKPGYSRYLFTKHINNGQVTEVNGGAGYWVKFDGNVAWIDLGIGMELRYVYQSTQNSGNKLYYFTPYNHGTISQGGSGYITDYNSYLLVSPDGKLLNMMRNNGKDGSVLRYQDVNNVGGMIE